MVVAYHRHGLHWADSQLIPNSTSYFSLTAAKMLSALPRQTTPLLQPKGLSTLFCCLSDTSTDLRYKHCCGLSVPTCYLYCDVFKPKASPKRPILPALSLLGFPRCMPYWYGRAVNVGIGRCLCRWHPSINFSHWRMETRLYHPVSYHLPSQLSSVPN